MTSRIGTVVCLALCLGGGLLLRAEEPVTERQEVQRLIEELDDDSYSVREAATKKLIEIGRPAVAALGGAAEESSLEVTDRAVQVLSEIYRSDDEVTLDAVEDVLEKLAESKRPSTARRAVAALNSKAEKRHKRAVIQLTKLKAMFPKPGMGLTPREGLDIVDVWLDKDWQGGTEGLQILKRLYGVRVLYLVQGCPVPEEAVLELVKSIPGLKIEPRGEACLGLSGGRPRRGTGVLIGKPTPGGSIMSAGLRQGDVVKKYQGETVESFEQLVDSIKKNKAGETVSVEYVRSGVVRTAEVKLKSWREVLNMKIKPKRSLPRKSDDDDNQRPK